GLPAKFRLDLSRDGTNWTAAAEGTFEFRSEWTPHAVIPLVAPVPSRFLRLTVLSLRESRRPTEPGFVMGELDVATPKHPLVPTTLIPVPQSREWNYGGYHWRRRHEAILAYAREHRPRLVFLGDSITHQWGGLPQSDTPKPGESVWNEFYGSRQAMDIGYGWDRVENMLWRVQHGELDEADPRLIVMLAGTNNLEVNTPEEIARGVERLCLEIHRRKPKARILLLGLFPRGENRKFPALDETNQRLRTLTRHRYLDFRDIGDVFLDDHGQLTRAIMPDLLHLSAEGYRRWAKAIEPEVSAAMNDK
ncbi:MAG: hypothetical protein IT581_19115, partial [Verrucomicrobiales bacterium]|nr:hypothetical protein [Verrucomicrobiales bacterium]